MVYAFVIVTLEPVIDSYFRAQFMTKRCVFYTILPIERHKVLCDSLRAAFHILLLILQCCANNLGQLLNLSLWRRPRRLLRLGISCARNLPL